MFRFSAAVFGEELCVRSQKTASKQTNMPYSGMFDLSCPLRVNFTLTRSLKDSSIGRGLSTRGASSLYNVRLDHLFFLFSCSSIRSGRSLPIKIIIIPLSPVSVKLSSRR